jgi:lysozyme
MIDAIFDISHWNASPDFAAAKAGGMLAVIQKATQGLDYVDPTLLANRANARAAGLMFGVYHFIVGGDGAAQGARFLSYAQPGDLLALDFEPNPAGPSASLADAEAFVGALPITPLLYGGAFGLLAGPAVPQALLDCPLWLAQYRAAPPTLPAGWSKFTLWQYADGHVVPAEPVPGIGLCDRDEFNGDGADLVAFWAAHSLAPG